MMNWVTVLVSSIISVCLALAAIHALVWSSRKKSIGNLMLSLSAAGSAGLAFCEYRMMRSLTTEEFGAALQWLHLPAFMVICGLVGFVRLQLKGGIAWLAWTILGIRLVSLVLNFLFEPNLNYLEVTHLRSVYFLGQEVMIGEGTRNPWMLVGQLSLFLLMVFGGQAAIQIGRRDGWGWSSLTAGSVAFFVMISFVQVVLVLWGILDMPLTPSLFYLPIVAAMGIGLSHDLLRAASLTDKLAEREQQMELAATAASLGMWVRDLTNDSIWATAQCRALFDFPEHLPITARDMFSRIDLRDLESAENAVKNAIRDKTLFQSEFRILRPDGSTRWLRAAGKADYDPVGRPVLVRGTCADITSAKLADEEALRLREELAHATRVNLMGQLASALAHELKQPLATVLRNAEAAEMLLENQGTEPDEFREILQDIASESTRAGDVIERMRSMLIRRKSVFCAVNPAKLVSDVRLMLQTEAGSKGVLLKTDIEEDLAEIRGDEVQLRQVLINLVLNGLEAASACGDGVVSIQAQSLSEGGVEFLVSDTGPGVPPTDVDRIFEPFFTSKTSGMGVGLAVSSSIVESHGGTLNLLKRASPGAVFRVRLPRDESMRAISKGDGSCG